jgi:hypothetical protein
MTFNDHDEMVFWEKCVLAHHVVPEGAAISHADALVTARRARARHPTPMDDDWTAHADAKDYEPVEFDVPPSRRPSSSFSRISNTNLTVVCVRCLRPFPVNDDFRTVKNAPAYCPPASCQL